MAVSKEDLIIQLKTHGVKLTKAQLKQLDAQVKTTTATMGTMGKVMAGVGFMAFGMAISKVIKTGKEFEQSMANVRAVSGATDKQFEALVNNAKKLGAETVHTASAVAGLQTEYAKLGFTADQIVQVTEGTLALSTAVGADLDTAASTAGATLKGFGLDVSETNRVTDVMALSMSKSALDMAKFTDSMKYVAPIAKQAGVSLEGTTAILGTLADSGIDGSMAGTSLRKILLEAGTAGSKLADAMGGPITSMEDFQEKMAKLKEDGIDPLADGVDLVGGRAVTAFGILLDGADKTEILKNELIEAEGAAQEMADIQLDTFEGSLKLAGSAVDGLSIKIFDLVEEPLTDMIKGFADFVSGIDEEEIKSYATALGIVAGAMMAMHLKTVLASESTKQLIRQQGLLRAAMMRTPWGLVAGVAAMAGGAILDATGIFDDNTEAVEENSEAVDKQVKSNMELADSIKAIKGEYDVDVLQRRLDKTTDLIATQEDLIDSYGEEGRALEFVQGLIEEYGNMFQVVQDKTVGAARRANAHIVKTEPFSHHGQGLLSHEAKLEQMEISYNALFYAIQQVGDGEPWTRMEGNLDEITVKIFDVENQTASIGPHFKALINDSELLAEVNRQIADILKENPDAMNELKSEANHLSNILGGGGLAGTMADIFKMNYEDIKQTKDKLLVNIAIQAELQAQLDLMKKAGQTSEDDAKKRAENLLNLEALRVEMERKDLSAMEKKTLKQKDELGEQLASHVATINSLELTEKQKEEEVFKVHQYYMELSKTLDQDLAEYKEEQANKEIEDARALVDEKLALAQEAADAELEIEMLRIENKFLTQQEGLFAMLDMEQEMLDAKHEQEVAAIDAMLEVEGITAAEKEKLNAKKLNSEKKYEKEKDKLRIAEITGVMDQSSQLIGLIGNYMGHFKGYEIAAARVQQGKAAVDMASAAMKAFTKFGGWPGGVIPAATSLATGAVQIAQIEASINSMKAQRAKKESGQFGLDKIINTPTNLLVGEGNTPERVQVTPLVDENRFGPEGGGTVNITFSGNINSDDFIENEAIPKIREAVLRGESLS